MRDPDTSQIFYAMPAFIGYAWCRMLCATAVRLRTVVCVPLFYFIFSYLVLSASDRRPLLPYSYTYTQKQELTPRVISSLPSVVPTLGITHGSLSPECLLYVSQRNFFSAACLFDTCSCDTMYLHHTANELLVICSPHPVSILCLCINTCSAAVLL